MRHLSSLAIVPLLALVGCYPFISGGRFDDKLCTLDEDGDGNLKCEHVDDAGATIPGDCDDDNPLKFHGNTETPYDGIDNDCAGGDELDVDDDDYPGIGRAAYEALGGEPWPSGLDEAIDCNDEDGSINPGASESWYDGVDSDCKADCDYDQDGDGFADARQGVDNDCGLPATDCLDISAASALIYPGAPGEVFYDGEDQDCDKVNDFDPDGDGDAWDGYQAQNSTFLTRYGYADTIDNFTECYDIDDGGLPQSDPLDPSTVSTKAIEVYNDGIDGDCGDLDGTVENDFDGDFDGYMPTGDRTKFLAYVQRYVEYTRHDGANPYKALFEAKYGANAAAWQAYFDARDNDCDDRNPAIHPNALEKLNDSIDQDCDGGRDTTPFVFGDFEFSGLGNPELVTTGSRFALLVNATVDADFGSGSEGAKVAALSFDLDATGTDAPNKDNTPYAVPSGDTLSPSLGLAGYNGGYFTAFGWERSNNTRIRATLSTAGSTSSSEFSVDDEADSSRVGVETTYPETDLVCDDSTNTCWAIGCDGTRFQFMEFRSGSTASTFDAVQSGSASAAAVDCFVVTKDLNSTLLLQTVASDGTVSAYTVNGSGGVTTSTSHPFTSRSLDNVQAHDGVVVGGLKSSGVLLWRGASNQRTVLSTRSTEHADASILDGDAYVIAVERGGGRLWLAYGNPAGSMTEVALPFQRDGSTLTPEFVAIEADGNRLAVAAVSSTDDLGWLFFEI